MLRLAAFHLRHRTLRSLALVLGILLATSGFTLLTAGARSSQLRTTGTVDDNYRGAYDILVRPQGARSALEDGEGLVRPNFLSGRFGGITAAQQERIARTAGVDTAAPVAMVGYVVSNNHAVVDLTAQVDRARTRQLLTLRPTWHSDRGLSRITDDAPSRVYVTKNPLLWPRYPKVGGGGTLHYADGTDPGPVQKQCGSDFAPVLEALPDGRRVPLCQPPVSGLSDGRGWLVAARLTADGTFVTGEDEHGRPVARERLTSVVQWPMTMLLAAVDPGQEARLVGLDKAVTEGRYLRQDETTENGRDELGALHRYVPLLASAAPQIDEQLRVGIERSRPGGAEESGGSGGSGGGAESGGPGIAGLAGERLAARLAALPGTLLDTRVFTADEVYGAAEPRTADLTRVIQSGRPDYRDTDPLTPAPVPVDQEALWHTEHASGLPVPRFAQDTAHRPLHRVPEYRSPEAVAGEWNGDAVTVGTFDPARLTEFSALSRVPLETYRPVDATAADAATRRLLGDRPLLPNGNPGGYLATPPQLLTTLAALTRILDPASEQARAPISAVRVRVAGVTGTDAASRERVRTVAEEITRATGLDVDLTMGSSPAPRTVLLGAGSHGRAPLTLSEGWSVKGVAVAVVEAADRKSVLISGLVLVVCVLFLLNAVGAGVRDRRRELAVLGCLGWTRRRVAGLVLTETALVGATAGTLGAVLSAALAPLLGIDVPAGRAALALPVALALSLLAALPPALRATPRHPARALRPAVRAARRPRRHRTLAGLAAANLARVPGRTALGALSLAVGVCAVTAVAAVLTSFHDGVVGTALGDAVALRVRGIDIAAAAGTVLLGALAVADVVFLGIRERAAEFAVLKATGWSDAHLVRLVLHEGAQLGALGATVGAATGAALVVWLTGTLTPALAATAAAAAFGGVLLTTTAALAPAAALLRLPTAPLLAED
ncbi:ABC transporter permease [Streptomyces sp. NPDC007863]|uniref:ABC transporter permease n=1 Tax=Streptomyces sp. NPDC007863 TaxID=3154894 RepID=UPI0033DD6E02